MKMEKSNCIILTISSLVILYLLISVGRFYINQNHIPGFQDYGLDFSSNSGAEAIEIMGTPILEEELSEQARMYYTYRKPVFGKDAEIELVVNELTDYFFEVDVTWEFDTEQEAQEWFAKVKREVRKNSFVPFVSQEKTIDATDWRCYLGYLSCKVRIYETKVNYRAVNIESWMS